MKAARDTAQLEAKETRNAAVKEASRWLTFIWGVSIVLAFSILVTAILLYRSFSIHVASKRETEYRRKVAALLHSTINCGADQKQLVPVVQAVHRLAGLDYKDSEDGE